MNRLSSVFLVCASFWILPSLTAQRLTCTPDKPRPGVAVEIRYQPAGGDLGGVKGITVTAYRFETGVPMAVEVPMSTDGILFTGRVQTTPATRLVLLSVTDADGEKQDDNDGQGHVLFCVGADGTTPVAGAYAEAASMMANYASLGGLKRDFTKAFAWMAAEIEAHPDALENDDTRLLYARLARQVGDQPAQAALRQTISEWTEVEKPGEATLLRARKLAEAGGMSDLVTDLSARLKAAYPDGEIHRLDLIRAFSATKDLAERASIFEELTTGFPADPDLANTLNTFASALAAGYGEAGDWDAFDQIVSKITDKSRQASALNNVAWGLSGESLDGEATDPARGKTLSARSLALLKEEMETQAGRPAYLTPARYRKNIETAYASYADTYALLAFKAGDPAEALAYQKVACADARFENGEMNERYAAYMEPVDGPLATEQWLAERIAQGQATQTMKAQHKRLFLQNNTLETAYVQVTRGLEETAKNRRKEELRASWMTMPAPDFTLTDLEGRKVSLASLKGKVVVLDFWATWCGPCKASFPAMQKTLDRFAGNDRVAFLFVDTWERVKAEDKPKNAADFIASQKYTFHVLEDLDNAVVGSYGVEGIPTKFIVDKEGIIRFKSTGFNGNDESLVQELALMIEMAGAEEPAVPMSGNP